MTGLELPPPPRPAGAYRPAILMGDMLFLSGFGPRDDQGKPIPGMVGRDMDVDQARAMARNVGLSLLSVIQDTLGTLDRVRQMVKVTGMVWCVPDFVQHPQVVDGCSQLLQDVLGERGSHARASFGVGSLPNGIPVEIDCICQVAL